MNLDLVNDLFNNLKENKFVQNFMKELSNYLENNITNNSKIGDTDYKWNDLFSDDLTLYNNKITVKYRDEMLTERSNILQNYVENTKEEGEMLYIYNISTNERNSYDLCRFKPGKNQEVITKPIEKLPEGTELGSILRKQEEKFILDQEATKIVGEEVNTMIREKIEEQNQYLDSTRIEGHTYEAGEKYSGRIWLYDLDNAAEGGIEGIEEIEFPKDLYATAKEGDLFVYENGEYHKKI